MDYDPENPNATGTFPVNPIDPYMLESDVERPGVTNGNAINGRDWDTTAAYDLPHSVAPRNDLQYACIFPLLNPQECPATDPSNPGNCDCNEGDEGDEDKPLCEEIPGSSVAGTTQYWGKAYPGTRQLEVLKGYGQDAVVASICARNVSDDSLPDFGYRPAVASIIERLKLQLVQAN